MLPGDLLNLQYTCMSIVVLVTIMYYFLDIFCFMHMSSSLFIYQHEIHLQLFHALNCILK